MQSFILAIIIWSVLGFVMFLKDRSALDWFTEMNWPQYFFVAFLFGPIIFIGALVNFVYVMLGKIN